MGSGATGSGQASYPRKVYRTRIKRVAGAALRGYERADRAALSLAGRVIPAKARQQIQAHRELFGGNIHAAVPLPGGKAIAITVPDKLKHVRHALLPAALLVTLLVALQANAAVTGYGGTNTINATGGQSARGAVAFGESLYTYGAITGSVDFAQSYGTAADIHAAGGSGAAASITKTTGGTYNWTRVLTDDTSAVNITSVYAGTNATAGGEATYVTGTFAGTVDFAVDFLEVASGDEKTAEGTLDGFVTRINADGTYAWTYTFGETGAEVNPSAITYDPTSNTVIAAGSFTGSVQFDTTGTLRTNIGGDDGFALWLADTALTPSFARDYVVASTSTARVHTAQATTADSGLLVLGGEYIAAADFDMTSTETALGAQGGSEGFVLQLSLVGVYANVQSLTGTGSVERVTELAVTPSGAIYAAGELSSSVTYSGGGAVTHSGGALDAFVIKTNLAGTLAWAESFGAVAESVTPSGLTVAADGTVYLAGTFSGSVNFGATMSASDTKTAYGVTSGFLTSFGDGNAYESTHVVGALEADGVPGDVFVLGLAANDPEELLYIVGSFTETIDFGSAFSSTTDAVASAGATDGFITAVVTSPPQTLSGGGLQYFSTSGVNLSSTGTQELSLAVNILDADDNLRLAQLNVDMTESRTWTASGNADLVAHKAFIANLTNQPGAGATYTFYVPQAAGNKAVIVCPGADELADVSIVCSGRATYTAGAGASIVNIDGTNYWAIPGQTATSIGGMSTAYPGLIITQPAGGLSVTEGTPATFTIKLATAPTDDVTVTPSVNGSTRLNNATTLTFTSENWGTPQDLTFAAPGNDIVDGPVDATISLLVDSITDTNYADASDPNITMQVLDNDVAGISWSPSSLTVSEQGASAQLCLELSSEPTDDVSFALNSSDTGEATVDGTITVTPLTWDTGTACATVTPINDNDIDAAQNAILSITSITTDDTVYAAITPGTLATVTATVQDDDTAGFVVSTTASAQTSEAGGSADICIKLTAQPTNTVTIPLESSDVSEGTLAASALAIEPADWDSPSNCVTVTGLNDSLLDGTVAYAILTGDPTSADTVWDDLGASAIANPSFSNTDDDAAGVTLSEASLVIGESGTTDTFTARLQSQPAPGNVVSLAVVSSVSDDFSPSPATLTFDNATWDTPQTVTVTAVQDSLFENTHGGTITVSVVAADTTESAYDVLANQTIETTITDDETAAVTVLATANATEGSENGNFTIALNRVNNTGGVITVAYDVLPASTAVAGTHFAALSGSVNIPVGASSANVSVDAAALNNAIFGGNRTVQIGLVSATGASSLSVGNPDTASLLIIDDETAVVGLSAVSGSEGGTIVFTATLSPANNTGSALVFDLDDVGGSATSSSDYAAFGTAAITIVDGATTGTHTIALTADGALEPTTESVVGGLQASTLPTAVSIGAEAATATATVTDLDEATVTVSASDAAEPSSAGGFVATLDKTNNTGSAIVVDVSISGTAGPGSDFTALAGSVSIASGSSVANLALAPIDDLDIEPVETVIATLTGTNFARVSVGSPSVATANVTDNETAAITVTTPDDTTDEDGATAQICFELTSRPSSAVTVALSSSDTSRVTVPASVTIERDNWDDPTCVNATGQDDTPPVVTGTQDVTISTGDVTSSDAYYDALAGAGVDDTTIHHADNDQASITVTSVDTVTSEDGTTTVHVRFSLSSEPTASVTIPVSIDDATEGALAGETEIVIGSAEWNTPATNELVIYGVDDNLTDGTITYHLETGAATSADGNYSNRASNDVTLTNSDDDAAGVAVDASATSATESGTITHTVAIASQPAPGKQVVITATPLNSQLDLGSGAGAAHALTFSSSNWGAQGITVTAVDDALLEAAHSSIVNYAIEGATDEQAYLDYATALPSFTVNITDNDTANATLSAADNGENSGTLTFTVTLDKTNNTGSGISFALNTTGGTATTGVDFTALTGGTISVAHGAATGTATVSVINDNDLEGDETVQATITDSSLAAATITTAAASAAILDDELANVSVTATDAAAEENTSDGGEFTISLSRPNKTDAPITVTYTTGGTAANPADYAALTGSAAIAVDASSVTVPVVTSANDEIVEGDETVTITLVTASHDQVNVDTTPGAVTIHDDDAYNWSITKQNDGLEQGEQAASFVVGVSKTNTTGSDMTIILTDPMTATATKTQDYASFDQTVAIPDGQNQAVVTIAVNDDALLESTETINAVISVPSEGTIASATANATITDNDTAAATLSAASGTEAGTDITYTVTLGKTNNTSAPVSFVLNTTGGTATEDVDYAGLSAVAVAVPVGSVSASVTTDVADDNDMEGPQTATATLSSSSNPSVIIAQATATATITDNDTASATAVATTPTAYEDGSSDGQITVQLTRANKTPAPITLTYTVGGTGASGSDFEALGGTAQIPVDATTTTVDISALDDLTAEGAETVIVTLTSADQALVSIGGQNAATVTIVDDDSFGWSVTTLNGGTENTTDITFRVQLSQSNATGHDLTAQLSDSGTGSATSGGDFAVFDGSVTIPDGDAWADVTVSVLDDALLERTETIGATLSSPSEGDVAVAAATATITDDETAQLSIEAAQSTASENPAVNGRFTITLYKTNDATAPILVNYTVSGSAVGGDDYAQLSGTANIPAGQDSTVIWVDMASHNDTTVESDETVTITLASTDHSGVQLSGDSSATVTIVSDDVTPPAEEPTQPISTLVAPKPEGIYVPLPTTPGEPSFQQEPTTPAPQTPPIDQTVADQDEDGLDDAAEDKAHNHGDGNGDGIPDSRQANVTSTISGVTQHPVTLAAAGDCTTVQKFTVVGEGDLDKDDLVHRYPHGLVDYQLGCNALGQSAALTIYYDQQLDGQYTWRKLAQPSLAFQAVDSARPALQAVGQGNVTTVSYIISDGGSLDDDGKADGKIIDPAGLAVSVFQPRDLLWLTPVVIAAGIVIARASVHHHRAHRANQAKIAKF